MTRRIVKYLLIFLVGLVIFIFSVMLGTYNDQIIVFNFLLAQCKFRISTLLSCLFGMGFILGWAICGLSWLRMRVALQHAKRKIKRMQVPNKPITKM